MQGDGTLAAFAALPNRGVCIQINFPADSLAAIYRVLERTFVHSSSLEEVVLTMTQIGVEELNPTSETTPTT